MASIDKIYGTEAQYNELYNWCRMHNGKLLKYFYPFRDDLPQDAPRAIASFSQEADGYLIDNCPLEFVRERLKEQYPYLRYT